MNIKNKILSLKKELVALERIESLYPDIEQNLDLFGKYVWNTELVNDKVTNLDIKSFCGISGVNFPEAYYARPFILVDDYVIHSNPVQFIIGEFSYKNKFDSDKVIKIYDYPERMMSAGIPVSFIKEASKFLVKKSLEKKVEIKNANQEIQKWLIIK